MRPRWLIVLGFFLAACESHTVEQIAVAVPPGVTVPEGMVYIPAGEFIMGHADEPGTARGQRVATGAYLIDRFEVSREKYQAVNPSPGYNEKTARLPAVLLTHGEALAYCQKRGKRLPSETEWEKAARGADGRKWPWSLYFDHPNDGFSGFIPEPVDKRKEWISPYGLYGMGHNVWEWTSDDYHYDGQPAAEKGRFKVIRGGLLQTHLSIRFSPTYQRNYIEPEARFNFIGFRCAKDVP